MRYEIAKALKDAGYPQERHDGTHYTQESAVIRNGVRLLVEECYAPTTSELISMCDMGWLKLEHHGENGWVALKGAQDGLKGEGKYADEALSNLFIVMNKK